MESIFSESIMLLRLINTESSVRAVGLKTSTNASVIFVIDDLAILFVSSPLMYEVLIWYKPILSF